MFGIDLLTGGALMILVSANAQACDMPAPPQINIVPRAKEIQYNYTQSLKDIQKYHSDTVNPYGYHQLTRTQGLAKGSIQLKLETKLAHRNYPGRGISCIWYESINVDINVSPEIIIAKEVYKDKCKHAAVLEHELKHVRADRLIVNKLSQTLGKKIYDTLSQRGFHSGVINTAYAEETAQRMQRTISQIVTFEQQKIEIERIEAQAEIDSREEYDRVAAVCD